MADRNNAPRPNDPNDPNTGRQSYPSGDPRNGPNNPNNPGGPNGPSYPSDGQSYPTRDGRGIEVANLNSDKSHNNDSGQGASFPGRAVGPAGDPRYVSPNPMNFGVYHDDIKSVMRDVTACTSAEQSALALINAIAARISEAGSNDSALAGLADALKRHNHDLALAVIRNTGAV